MSGASEYLAQRNALVAAALLVPDIGRVHDRPRYGDAFTHWVTTIDGREQIRAWEIGIGDAASSATSATSGDRVERISHVHRHRWRTWALRGYVSLVDGSEAEPVGDPSYDLINTLARDIADQWDLDNTHGGTFLDSDPTQVGEVVVISVGGGHLCWGVTLSLTGYTVNLP